MRTLTALAAALVLLQQPLFAQAPVPNKNVEAIQVAPTEASPHAQPGTCCPSDPCGCGYHFYVFADYLMLRARGADIPYAQPVDGVSPLAVPMGPVATSASDFSAGYRFGLGFGLGQDTYVQGTYTTWSGTSDDSVTAPAGTVLKSLLTFPTTANVAADSQAAALHNDIDFKLVDIDLKHRFWQSGGGSASWLVGARYAELNQQMVGDFTILGPTTVASNIDFSGAGVRLGLEGEYCICGGFFVFGRGVANFVAGRFESTYLQTNAFAGTQASTGVSENRIVPIFDLEAGLGWQCMGGRFRVAAGYYFSSWCNVLTTNSLIQGVQGTNFTTNGDNFRDNINFDGLTARIELRF